MKIGLIIDLAVVVLLLFLGWNGFKNGLIRSIIGVLVVVIALYGATLVAKMYSGEFSGMFKPFLSGMLERSTAQVTGSYDGEEGGPLTTTVTVENKDDVYEVCFATLRNLGLSEGAASRLADTVKEGVEVSGRSFNQFLTETVCDRVAYVCVFLLAFIILGAVLAIIGNTIDIVFTLPGLGVVDSILGAILGLAKGFLIVMAVAMFLRYTGLLLKDNVVRDSYFVSKLLNNNPIANLIGL